tara:strand:- start:1299 stop:1847 length:549 start_codon:yes stop_codon:yes gene_type:complete
MLMKNSLINLIFLISIFIFSTAHTLKLDTLFEKLSKANNLNEAKILEEEIWDNWLNNPNSEYLTDKLENATFSMNHQQYQIALKLFTDIINEDPNWAEGWNKRATLLYIIGNYEKSLEDIEKVLEIEPRHFGALSGRAQIYFSQQKYEKALKDLEKVKSIYPLTKNIGMIELIKKIIKEQQI